MAVQTSLPRLDHSEDFGRAFATLLPRLIAKDISQGKAARELGISVLSLKRYMARVAGETQSLTLSP